MKKSFFLALFSFFVASAIYAERVPGRITFADGRVEDVTFDLPMTLGEPNIAKIQNGIKYFDEAGKKKTLEPEDAREIEVESDAGTINMISVKNNLGLGNPFGKNRNIFLVVEIDGKLKLLTFNTGYHRGGGLPGSFTPGFANPYAIRVFYKENSGMIQTTGSAFRGEMVKYFDDCPELATMIEKKEYRPSDLQSIVGFYNRNCAGAE